MSSVEFLTCRICAESYDQGEKSAVSLDGCAHKVHKVCVSNITQCPEPQCKKKFSFHYPDPIFSRIAERISLGDVSISVKEDNEEVDCTVCQSEPYTLENPGVLFQGCGHRFHQECIERWANARSDQGGLPNCPQCKAVAWDTDNYFVRDPIFEAALEEWEKIRPLSPEELAEKEKEFIARIGNESAGIHVYTTVEGILKALNLQGPKGDPVRNYLEKYGMRQGWCSSLYRFFFCLFDWIRGLCGCSLKDKALAVLREKFSERKPPSSNLDPIIKEHARNVFECLCDTYYTQPALSYEGGGDGGADDPFDPRHVRDDEDAYIPSHFHPNMLLAQNPAPYVSGFLNALAHLHVATHHQVQHPHGPRVYIQIRRQW